MLNAAGQVAFTDFANTGGGGEYGGIWRGTAGDLSLVARTGMDAPGASGTTLGSLEPTIGGTQFGLICFNNDLIVFAAELSGTNVVRAG